MKYSLTLNYSVGEGWLTPWVDGLRGGRALGSTCKSCDKVQFPPLRYCPACGAHSEGWRELSGRAEILHRTIGRDGDFALVRFNGAEGGAVVRSELLPENATHGWLEAVGNGPLVMRLRPED